MGSLRVTPGQAERALSKSFAYNIVTMQPSEYLRALGWQGLIYNSQKHQNANASRKSL